MSNLEGKNSLYTLQGTVLTTSSTHRIGDNRKLSTNVNQKSIETEFSIVICRPSLAIFDPRSSIVKNVFD